MNDLLEYTERLPLHRDAQLAIQQYETQIYQVVENLSASPEDVSVEIEERPAEITITTLLSIEVCNKSHGSTLASNCTADRINTITVTSSTLTISFEPLTITL